MSQCSESDFFYKWMSFEGRDCLRLNDFIIELPDLPLPENARFIGPLLQGLYGRHRPTISQRLQQLLICTLDNDPNYFDNVKRRRRWYYIVQPEKNHRNPRKIAKKRGRKPKAREQPSIVELD